MQNKKNVVIFIDFEAIYSLKNIFINFFENDDNINELFNDYEYGIISAKEFWSKLFTKFEKVHFKKLEQSIKEIKLDKYFIDFINFCEKNKLKHIIISDNFDFIINKILDNNGLKKVLRIANSTKTKNGKLEPVFSFSTESCFCNYGSCLRNIMLCNSDNNDIIIFIGNNYQAGCLAMHSDIVFASKSLAKFCVDNKIPHYPYKNFFDIKHTLDKIIFNNKLKKRNQAQLLRKSAYEIE